MKCTALLIIFLSLSFHAMADGALILRGRVPASFSIDTSEKNHPVMKTNSKAKNLAPMMVVNEFKKHTLITVIQR